MDDQTIIRLFWQRDETAIAAVAAQYGGYCRSIAGNVLGDREDVEECLNDTWLRAWNAIPPHEPPRLALFLGKITRELGYSASWGSSDEDSETKVVCYWGGGSPVSVGLIDLDAFCGVEINGERYYYAEPGA